MSRSPLPRACSPANAEAAQLFRDNLKEYNHRVRNTVELSWMDDEPEATS